MALPKFPLGIRITAIDDATATVRKITDRLSHTLDPLRKVTGSVRAFAEATQYQKVLKGFQAVGAGVGQVVRSIVRGATYIGGAALGAAAGVYAIVRATAHAAVESATLAKKLGVNVRWLQEMHFAADMAEVSEGAFDKAMKLGVKNLGLAAVGNKKVSEGYRRLGINIFDARHKVRSMDSILPEVADRLNQLADPMRRAAIMATLFGKSGAEILPLMLKGSRAIAEFRAEARRLGLTLDDEVIEASFAFDEAWKLAKWSMLGARNAIGAALLPALSKLIEEGVGWFIKNRLPISQWAKEFAEHLPERIHKLVEGLKELRAKLEPVVEFGKKLVERFGPVPLLITAIATAFTISLVPAVFTTISALVSLSVALVSTPAGWVVLALAAIAAELAFVAGALAALAYLAYRHWDEIVAVFRRARDWIVRLWRDPVGTISEAWAKLPGLFFSVVTNVVAIVQRGRNLLSAGFVGFVGFVMRVTEPLRSFFAGLWDSILGRFEAVYEAIASKVRALSDLVPEWLRSGIRQVISSNDAPANDAVARASRRRPPAAGETRASTEVRVDFSNLPRGARVEQVANDGVALDLSLGYSMGGG